MAKSPTHLKNWRIESSDGMRVVRLSAAGVILSDHTNEPTLFDYNTAVSVAEQVQGILSLERLIVTLVPRPQEPKPKIQEQK